MNFTTDFCDIYDKTTKIGLKNNADNKWIFL